MILVTGGAYQGKQTYAIQTCGVKKEEIWSDPLKQMPEPLSCINGFHRFVRTWLDAGLQPQEKILELLCVHPQLVILVDEIGNGIVPLDPEERRWREVTGRTCQILAAQAEQVIRVLSGIPVQIK